MLSTRPPLAVAALVGSALLVVAGCQKAPAMLPAPAPSPSPTASPSPTVSPTPEPTATPLALPDSGDPEMLAAPSPRSAIAALPAWDQAKRCGVERWPVKIGSDPAASSIILQPKVSTLTQMAAITAPKVTGSLPRQAAEKVTYQISGTLVQAKVEADSDYHLIVRDTAGHSLVAEIPHPSCALGSTLLGQITDARRTFDSRFPQMQHSSNWVVLNAPVTLVGVGFFDFAHGQTGEASNDLELHPVLTVH